MYAEDSLGKERTTVTRNVTLRMEEKLLRELRHRAVDAQMSLSAWITAVLEDHVRGRRRFERARKRAVKRLTRGFGLGGTPIPRDELHAR